MSSRKDASYETEELISSLIRSEVIKKSRGGGQNSGKCPFLNNFFLYKFSNCCLFLYYDKLNRNFYELINNVF